MSLDATMEYPRARRHKQTAMCLAPQDSDSSSLQVKVCSTCKTNKDESEFHKDRTRRAGIRDVCKSCSNDYSVAYRKSHPDEMREGNKAWREKNRDYSRAKALEYNRANPRRCKAYALKHLYGLSIDEFDAMMLKQEGRCAICEEVLSRGANTDHCHSTGVVRGILCTKCNQGLGMFHDSIDMMHRAIDYLRPRILKEETA